MESMLVTVYALMYSALLLGFLAQMMPQDKRAGLHSSFVSNKVHRHSNRYKLRRVSCKHRTHEISSGSEGSIIS